MKDGYPDRRSGAATWVWILGIAVVLGLGFLVLGAGGNDPELADDVGGSEPVAGETSEADPGIEAGGRAPIAPEVEEYMTSCASDDPAPIRAPMAAQCVGWLVAAVQAAAQAGIGEMGDASAELSSARSSVGALAGKPDITTLDGALIEALSSVADALDEIAQEDVPALSTSEVRSGIAALESGAPISRQQPQLRAVLDSMGEALSTLTAGSAAAGV